MANLKRLTKVIIFDTLAGICFLGVALFGWLPGPGGLPLLLAGLSLLAVNHDWAERLLEKTKVRGMSLKQHLFPDDPYVRAFYDILCVAFIITGLYITLNSDDRLVSAAAVMIITFALAIFLFNRERFDKFSTLFKKTVKKKK